MDLIVSTHLIAQNSADVQEPKTCEINLEQAAEAERQRNTMAELQRAKLEGKREECMNRSLLEGLATGPIVFALVYFTQKRVLRDYQRNSPAVPLIARLALVSSAGFGIAAAYIAKSQCQTGCEKRYVKGVEDLNRQLRAADNK